MEVFKIKQHKTKILASALVGVLVLVSFTSVLPRQSFAAPNLEINYQGKLTNASNVAVADGTYNMQFWLIASSTAATSTAVWSESHTGADRVQVTSGLFSVMLGSIDSLAGVDFNQTLYLGVEIGGTDATPSWDGEMSPRKVLGTVPAAFVANTLDGLDSTQFVRTDATSTIAASSADTLLTITQNGAGDIINIFDGSTEVFTILDGGNIGIGSSTPSVKLTVGGDAYIGGNVTATGTLAVSGHSTLTSASSTNLTVSGNSYLGTVTSGTWNGSTIGETYGGTGQTTYATGDLLYASGADTLAKRTIGTTGDVLLVSGGVPTWVATSTLGISGVSTFLGLSDTPDAFTAGSVLFTSGSAVTEDNAQFYWDDTSNRLAIGHNSFTGIPSGTDLAVISTTTATARFSVANTNGTDVTAILDARNDGSVSAIQFGSTSNHPLYFYTNNTQQMTLLADGKLGIGDTTPSALLTVGDGDLFQVTSAGLVLAPNGASGAGNLAYSFVNDTDTGWYLAGTNELRLQTGGADRFVIDASGNIAIGTTTATEKLTISGNLAFASDAIMTILNNSSSAFAIATSTSGTALFSIDTTAGAEEVTIGIPGGDVLIGSVGASTNLVFEESATIHGQGTNTLTFGTEGDKINFAVNIGIGTGTPSNALTIVTATSSPIKIINTTASSYTNIYYQGTGRSWTAGVGNGSETTLGVADKFFIYDVASATPRFTIDTQGNVGIGTTSPLTKFQVENNDTGDVEIARFSNFSGNPYITLGTGITNSTGGVIKFDDTNDLLQLGVHGSGSGNYLYVGNTGSVGIGTTTFSSSGCNGKLCVSGGVLNLDNAQAIAWGGGTGRTSITGSTAAGTMTFALPSGSASTNVYSFSNGNVGIGTTSPSAKLDVYGTAGSSDLFAISSSTNERVFAVDANGGIDITTTGNTSALYITAADVTSSSIFNIVGPVSTSVNDGKAFSFSGPTGLARGMFYTDGKYGMGPGTAGRDTFISRYATSTLMVSSDATASGAADLIVTGNVGIGTTTPTSMLTIQGDNDALGNMIIIQNDGTSPNIGNYINFKYSDGGGTVDANEEAIGGLTFQGTHSTGFNPVSAAMRAVPTEAFTSTAAGTALTFLTTANTTTTLTERLRINQNGNIGIAMTNPSVALDVTGDIEYTGTITDVSDRRLKENIQQLSGNLEKLLTLEPVSFTMKDDEEGEVQLGFIAQNVLEVYQEPVSYIDPDNSDYLGLDYTQLVAPTVGALIELHAELSDLFLYGTTTASSTFAALFDDHTDTVWQRLVTLAQHFVDGVLTISGLKTEEICLSDDSGETCVDRSALRALLDDANQPVTSSGGESDMPEETENSETPAPQGSTESEEASVEPEGTGEGESETPVEEVSEDAPQEEVTLEPEPEPEPESEPEPQTEETAPTESSGETGGITE